MTFQLMPNDIILDDSNFLRLAFDGYVMSGEGLSERAHFDLSRALEVLKEDPFLGARLLGSAPGGGTIFYTGEMASERIGGKSVGVRVVSRRTGDEITGDNMLGEFLGRVREAYRESLRDGLPPEEPVREGQVIADFTRKGAFMSDIEAREEAGERFIHVDSYRPVRFRFDASRNGTTGHASRRSDEDVPFHRFVCPFGTAYPSPIIVGSAAEASFLYEKALRGELDWNALFDDLSVRGLMKKDVGERQRSALIADYKAQFAWMREQICKDSSLRALPIVSSGILVPDASLGRSVYDAELAPSPAHVLARYINNPVLLFGPAENSVFRAFAASDKNELVSFRGRDAGSAGGDRSVNVLVIGSDVLGGREPGRKATTEAVRRKVTDASGNEVWVMHREPRIPMKSKAETEEEYAAFAARMDSVLSTIPAGVKVNLITGSASSMGDSVGVGTPRMVYRYAMERGGNVKGWDFKSGRLVLKDGAKEAAGSVVAVMMDHLSDCLPVLAGYDDKVSFPLDREVEDMLVSFDKGSGLVSEAAVCFTMHDDTNTRNVLSMGSYVAAAGLPVIHVIDNCSGEQQAALLSSGAQMARSSLSGESTEGGHALDGVQSRDWDAASVNVLSFVDRETGFAHPFVVNRYPGAAVVGGQSFHSALGTYVALVAEALGQGDRQTLLKISRAEDSLSGLMGVYGAVALSGGRLDDAVMESCLRRSVRMMCLADSGFSTRLLDVDGRDIVMPVAGDAVGSGLFTDLDLRGENRFGIILTDERSRLVAEREERRKAAEAERQAIVEEAARRQKLVVGNRAEGQKVQGGFPGADSGRPDAVWFLGTNTPDQFVLPDGEHSFEMWDDMGGDDPLVREKAVRPYVDDGDGGKVPNRFVFLFPSDLKSVTGKGTVPRNPDSRDLTGVMRRDDDGNLFVCAYGVPVRVNKNGYEINNDDNLPCSYRMDNDASNFAESLVLADSAARSCAIRHNMVLMLPGRTRRDGSEYYTLGQVFMDKVYNREEKCFVRNPHRSPLNYDLTERYVNLLQRGRDYPLNYVPMPQAEYALDGSADDVARARSEAAAEDRPYISAEGRFISDLLLSLRIANSLAVSLNVPLRFPLDAKGRTDLGPGVPEEFRALAERRIDSFIGVVREEDIIGTKLPVLERISLFDAAKCSESFQKAKDLYIRPNELVYAFGGYDFDDILASRNVPLHEMAFRMEDGTVVMLSDAKVTRGMDPEDVNKYLSYEKNDERRFVVRTTNLDRAGEFISQLQSYCERAKAVRVEARLLSVKEAVREGRTLSGESAADGPSMAGYVKLFSSNSDQFATNEHEIGRTQSIYNSTSRFDGFDAEQTYWGKVDAKDGFEGYAQLRYVLPDGKQSGWFTVTDLELAKDMVMSMVNRTYRDERVVPSAAVMKMLMTAEAVRFSGEEFRAMDFEGRRREVDDKVVRLEGVPAAKPVNTEREDVSVRSEASAKAQAAAEPQAFVPSIDFTESSGGYQVRTSENANAPDVDFTLSFALDFDTYGERATARAAGDSLIKVPLPLNRNGAGLDCSAAAVKAAVDAIADMLPDEYLQGEEFGLNIAGNGIYTLNASGISQKQCDEFVTRVLSSLTKRGAVISSVRSGGQTGIDEAGAVAGCVLQVPTTVHAPKGWQQRGADGRDVSGERAFKARFAGKDYASLRAMVAASRRKEQTVKNVISN